MKFSKGKIAVGADPAQLGSGQPADVGVGCDRRERRAREIHLRGGAAASGRVFLALGFGRPRTGSSVALVLSVEGEFVCRFVASAQFLGVGSVILADWCFHITSRIFL